MLCIACFFFLVLVDLVLAALNFRNKEVPNYLSVEITRRTYEVAILKKNRVSSIFYDGNYVVDHVYVRTGVYTRTKNYQTF